MHEVLNKTPDEEDVYMALTMYDCPGVPTPVGVDQPVGALGIGQLIHQRICKSLVQAHDWGLTRLREINRDSEGMYTTLVFEQVLTPAGEAFMKRGMPKRTGMDEETKAWFRARFERQLETGVSDADLMDAQGRVAGHVSDFMTPEQVRENARVQLDILDGKQSAKNN